MQNVFTELTGIDAKHEYMPHCIGKIMEDLNNNDIYSDETERDISEKVKKIRKINGCYIDTGQAFMKSYIYRLIDEFDDMYCIHLFRNPKDVVESWKSRKPSQQEKWHLKSHWDKNILRTDNVIPVYENWEWECGEIKARVEYYQPYFTGQFDFDFNDLNDPTRWGELFDELDIPSKKFIKGVF